MPADMTDGRFQQDHAQLGMADERVALARRARRRQRALAIGIAFVAVSCVAVLAAQAEIGGSAATRSVPRTSLTADATAVTVLRPNVAAVRVAQAHPVLGGAAQAREGADHYALDEAGSLALVDNAQSTATLRDAAHSTRSEFHAQHITLLGGRVVIDGAQLIAHAQLSAGRASSSLTWKPGATITIDGVATKVTANQQVAIQGIGTLVLNEQAVLAGAPRGDTQSGPRSRVVGAVAHLRITVDQPNAPAGTEIIIGRVDAGVRQGKITAAPPAPSDARPAAAPASLPTPAVGALNPFTPQTGTPKPGELTLPRKAATTHAGAVATPTQDLQQYVFPVLGQATYSNDYGAARADTGAHQGNDIFAAEGTPLVAVADGTLDRVGWNTIGGYRFWLFDAFGNGFYYAHLSAYAPLAQDGAQVHAGDVIGFVGHTGDAQGTPNHVHFEIHPGNGDATNPFPYLNAWRHGVAVAIGMTSGSGTSKRGSSALLTYSDIAPNSGLQGSVLDSVPDTQSRPIAAENEPQPSDDTLREAVGGNGISR